jgi:GT2 family glycosyltransferase
MTTDGSSPTEVSVVIPVRNGASLLRFQLEALAGQVYEGKWEIVVADNGSTDNLAEVVAEFADRVPWLRIVDASDHSGASHARNVGATSSTGANILFVDADDVVGAGFVKAMHEGLKRSSLVAARFDPWTLNPQAMPNGLGTAPAQTEILNLAYAFLPWCGSGGVGVRRDAFDRIGGFDLRMGAGEDTDFSWRAQLAGFTIELIPDAVVQLRDRQGMKSGFQRGRFYGAAGPNLYRTYRAHGMPRRSRRAVVRYHGGLLKRSVRIRSRNDLEAWLFLAGNRVGVIEGCLRHRVLYL